MKKRLNLKQLVTIQQFEAQKPSCGIPLEFLIGFFFLNGGFGFTSKIKPAVSILLINVHVNIHYANCAINKDYFHQKDVYMLDETLLFMLRQSKHLIHYP